MQEKSLVRIQEVEQTWRVTVFIIHHLAQVVIFYSEPLFVT